MHIQINFSCFDKKILLHLWLGVVFVVVNVIGCYCACVRPYVHVFSGFVGDAM